MEQHMSSRTRLWEWLHLSRFSRRYTHAAATAKPSISLSQAAVSVEDVACPENSGES